MSRLAVYLTVHWMAQEALQLALCNLAVRDNASGPDQTIRQDLLANSDRVLSPNRTIHILHQLRSDFTRLHFRL